MRFVLLSYKTTVTLLILLPCAAAAAVTPNDEPLRLVPADALLTWHATAWPGLSDSDSARQQSSLETLLELGATVLGRPVNSRTAITLRAAELLGVAARYPHALSLLDAEARPSETDANAPRVHRLRAVLVVHCDDDAAPLLRVIQKTINEQTDAQAATLRQRKSGPWRYQELHDSRLPDWAIIAWGRIGPFFVLTVGPDVWPAVAAIARDEAGALARSSWLRDARRRALSAFSKAPSAPPFCEITLAAEATRRRLDPFVHGRASTFFEAWDAEGLERAYWSLGFQDRALYCAACYDIKGQELVRVYAEPAWQRGSHAEVIPPTGGFAVFRLPVERFLPRFIRGLLATQGDDTQANLERIWREIIKERELAPERDILARLGSHVVMHHHPPHPLGIPLACTVLIEIRDDPPAVRAAVDALSDAWRQVLNRALIEASSPPPFLLQRDGDGLWYIRFGPLAGPAWTVHDGYLMLSWSPRALREAIREHPGG